LRYYDHNHVHILHKVFILFTFLTNHFLFGTSTVPNHEYVTSVKRRLTSTQTLYMIFEILMAVSRLRFSWMLCHILVDEYQRFGGTCCLHRQDRRVSRVEDNGMNVRKRRMVPRSAYSYTLKMEAAGSSETLFIYKTTRRHIPEQKLQ
jgi:hypothetical protein